VKQNKEKFINRVFTLLIMTVKHFIDAMKNQDKLEENLLRTVDGNYVKPDSYGLDRGNGFERFSMTQDKLRQGFVKLNVSGDYISVDNMGYTKTDDCFIATAVYGSKDAPQVQALRGFRDDVLAKSAAGRAFTNFYYSGAGEATANFIRTHLPSTIPVIRKGLDLIVAKCSS
jgi:hypothetical protein